MNKENEPLFTPEDIGQLARDFDHSIEPELKKRILDKVHEHLKDKSRERGVETERDKPRPHSIN